MSHMVIFQTPDGNPGYNQFDTISESVTFVESLRNDQAVQNARIFKLEEVKFDFKAYYKVELNMLEAGSPSNSEAKPAPAAPAAPAASAPTPPPAPSAPAPPAPPSPPQAPASSTPPPPPAPPAPPAPPSPPAPAPASEPAAKVDSPDSPVGGGSDADGESPARRGLFGR